MNRVKEDKVRKRKLWCNMGLVSCWWLLVLDEKRELSTLGAANVSEVDFFDMYGA